MKSSLTMGSAITAKHKAASTTKPNQTEVKQSVVTTAPNEPNRSNKRAERACSAERSWAERGSVILPKDLDWGSFLIWPRLWRSQGAIDPDGYG